MTAAPATPRGARERLLQAIDGQSNQICNMVGVMEVISFLEKHPITKEALEETRLGKLINDVRKKTKNEDLAKRAKKLLRNWQKLIEPGKGEALAKERTGASWSSNGGAHPCVPAPAASTAPGQTGPELKNRTDFNNCFSPRPEKPVNRKRRGDQREGQKSKTALNDKIQNSSGTGSSSEFSQPLDSEVSEPSDNDRRNQIPVNAIRPHPSSLGYGRPRAPGQEQAASGGQRRPRSPRCSLPSPQSPTQEAVVRKTSHAHSPTGDTFLLGPCPQPLNVAVQGFHGDGLRAAPLDCPARPPGSSVSHPPDSSSFAGSVHAEDDGSSGNTGKRKRQRHRSVEDGTKPVRLKDRRLTFDPVTGQIRSSFHQELCQEKEAKLVPRLEPQWSDQSKQNPPVPPSPLQQTDWKELSRSEIIQSYLSQQSNVLTSSGAHAPGAHYFMTEFLKKEDHRSKGTKETLMLEPERPAKDFPGVSRAITSDDLRRLHAQHWSGVNGCYDTKGSWYDWTDCISLDPHGDESGLNILPYVCLD